VSSFGEINRIQDRSVKYKTKTDIMKINEENYQAFLLDMTEGRLSAGQQEELLCFLEENPGLEADPDIGNFTLPAGEIAFPSREDLKKGASAEVITTGNYDQFCIASLEGDLSASGEERLDAFLENNPLCASEALIYKRLVLKADKAVVYPRKGDLKRSRIMPAGIKWYQGKRVIYRAGSVAAAIAVLLSAYFYMPDNTRQEAKVALPAVDILVLPVDAGYRSSQQAVIIPSPAIPETRLPEVTDELRHRDGGHDPMADRAEMLTFTDKPDISSLRVQSSIASASAPAGPPGIAGLYRQPLRETEVFSRSPGSLVRGLAGSLARGSGRQDDQNPVSSVRGLAGSLVRGNGAENEPKEERGLSFWDVAHAGVKGINSVAGTGMSLEHEYDQNGNLVHLTFSSRIIEFQRSSSYADDSQ
jgi:hypothetical protein